MSKIPLIQDLNLNPEQLEAVTTPRKPLLIIAGAGTGKTKALTTRIVYLIESGVPAHKICALTFTNKAAEEMLQRVESSLQSTRDKKNSINKPLVTTFHSLGAKILREVGHFLNRKPNFTIFDDSESFQLIKKVIKNTEGLGKIRPADLSEKISTIKNGMTDPQILERDPVLKEAFQKYEAALLANNAFDFDDLIQKVVYVFQKHPEVLERYQKKFSDFLVDEYQDINGVQYKMIKLLADREKNLSVVGDHNQTIYSWRGAKIDIFLNFENHWENASLVFLGQNYRSTKNIINAASKLIQNNLEKPKGLKEINLWTSNPQGEKIILRETSDELEEAEWITGQIQIIKNTIEKESIAILYRTNAQSRALEQTLIEYEIPYRIFGGLKFYDRREIKDIVAALKLISNPEDQLSAERLQKLLKKAGFIRLKSDLENLTDKDPLKVIEVFLKSTNYFEYLNKNFTNPDERKENIAELITFASSFPSLEEFLERATLLQSTDDTKKQKHSLESGQKLVTLMTIHLAKGLEFNNVFIAGINEGVLPHHRSYKDARGLEEERRLLYVAMTRARKKLFLSFYDLPSRFLSEIPEEFLELEGVSDLNSEERYITLD